MSQMRYVGIWGDHDALAPARTARLDGERFVGTGVGGDEVVVWVFDGPNLTTTRSGDGSWAIVSGWIDGEAADVLGRVAETGPDRLRSVNGEFSSIVWVSASGRLHLIRAKYGNPPVFYAEAGTGVVFSETIDPILRAGVPARVDQDAVGWFLSCGYLPPPRTMFDRVRKIPAGHAIVLPSKRVDARRYWSVSWGGGRRDSFDQRVATLGDLMTRAVDTRLATSGTTGVLLSGGVDSGLLVAIARRVLDRDVVGFTFRYGSDAGAMNEGTAARELAAYVGADHVEIDLTADWVAGHLEQLVAAYEEPFGYALHTARLDPIATTGVEVVLSGVCTDGWYVSRREAQALRVAGLGGAAELATGLAARLPGRIGARGRTLHELAFGPVEQVFFNSAANTLLREDEQAAVSVDGASHRVADETLSRIVDETYPTHRADQLTHLAMWVKWPEHGLLWNFRWGRRAGLDVRNPYIDDNLVAYLAGSPRPHPAKADFRALAATLVPEHMAYRPKFPQSLPLGRWLRYPLRDLVHAEVGAVDFAEFGLDTDRVLEGIDDHLSGRADRKWLVWSALVLSMWRRIMLARRRDPLW